jgi:hypothetical protein
MKKAMVRKWVKALRSGKYKKARGGLKVEGGYCCLGVLNKVCGLGDSGHRPCLSIPVSEKIGLGVNEQCHLIEMNDGKRSFNYIANYLERKFLT